MYIMIWEVMLICVLDDAIIAMRALKRESPVLLESNIVFTVNKILRTTEMMVMLVTSTAGNYDSWDGR